MDLASLRISVRAAAALFRRAQPVTLPMVVLFAIIPFYLVIGAYAPDRLVYSPEMALDAWFPQTPAWSVVYLSLFLAAFLPVFVVHQPALVQRVILAYLSIWLVAFAIFLAYPTGAPKHAWVIGDDFFAVALRTIYRSDLPYNCFPSLHVAQAFLAAFTCSRVHRGVGFVVGLWACLLALSTLYTKQHYVADAFGGLVLAYAAHYVFLRSFPREATPEAERRLAPLLALGALATFLVIVLVSLTVYFVWRR